jgi:ferredoxin
VGDAVSREALSRRMFLRGPVRAAKPPLQVRAEGCLGSALQVCTVCVEHCEVSGAIRMIGLIPRIDPTLCTACGRCAEVCPSPGRALVFGEKA